MESLKGFLASPAVQKLRHIEQRRVSRTTAKHRAARERLVTTLKHLDREAKESLVETLRTQADDLDEIILGEKFSE
jgi:dynactin complex subunit